MAKISSLCVYCGASSQVPDIYKKAARTLGRILAEAGVRLVFGGGRVGLMGEIADAALAAGGRVVGVIPKHLEDFEIGHRGVSELVVVGTMHERKQRMFELADAFAILPGGLGTLDETFEIVTWKQLGLHDKPVALIDVAGYWQPLDALIRHMTATGFVASGNDKLMITVETVEELLPALEALPSPIVRPQTRFA
ncbi:MAG: TIGR00730 family Rossman fold protein [Proteobacteria bacterium]|nr:TIGR00730 family Rossman fold protein [Pseudomonadota bacterium]MBI3499857.1 TIGR00730 family Rossman fold protein [Pseudomonadota bacterium]